MESLKKHQQKGLSPMANTTPNKETIRRISLLHDATFCYINVSTGDEYVEALANIKTEKMKSYKKKLEAWSGMKFRVYNMHSKREQVKNLKITGEKILPINL